MASHEAADGGRRGPLHHEARREGPREGQREERVDLHLLGQPGEVALAERGRERKGRGGPR
eukprot:7672528-Lingulodinium_polyedra.AAC.1